VGEAPIVETRYYRAALRGLLTGVFELVCSRAYVHERIVRDPRNAILFRIQWV
jgi:hypothetical protein